MNSASATAGVGEEHGLRRLAPLLRELGDLKRVHVSHRPGSLAQQGFSRAWSRLAGGSDPAEVALDEAARSIAAARLAGVDAAVLRDAGLAAGEIAAVLRRALGQVCDGLDPALRARLENRFDAIAAPAPADAEPPAFAARLARQPRAGATKPGQPRLTLVPAENHAEHCYVTAVNAVLVSPLFNCREVGTPFLAAMAHHFHNAYLPDSGFTGEVLLGEHLAAVMDRFTERALGDLPSDVAGRVRAVLADVLPGADTAPARAFHAADVIDRVLEMAHHARAASFQLSDALDEMELVHAGPLQAFQNQVVAVAGLADA